MDTKPEQRVVMVLRTTADRRIEGRLEAEEGQALAFSGWLELVGALEKVIGCSET